MPNYNPFKVNCYLKVTCNSYYFYNNYICSGVANLMLILASLNNETPEQVEEFIINNNINKVPTYVQFFRLNSCVLTLLMGH